MYASSENISDRVAIEPRNSASIEDVGDLLKKIGFTKISGSDSAICWEQNVRYKETFTSVGRRISCFGNRYYTAFVFIDGSTPTQVKTMSEFGDTPEDRLKKYLEHMLEGFVVDVLAHHFDILDRYS